MGLVTKEVEVGLNSRNMKHYEDLGYKIPKKRDKQGRLKTPRGTIIKINVNDLTKGSHVSVDVKCDGCEEDLNVTWKDYLKYVKEDNKYYCNKCGTELFGKEKANKTRLLNSLSFKQWCYNNLSHDEASKILERWDSELNIDKNDNIITPEDICFSSGGLNGKGYWFKCLNFSEHKSELKNINNFIRGEEGSIECRQCKTIAIKRPDIIKYFKEKEDVYTYTPGQHIIRPMICPDCGYEKDMKIQTLSDRGFSCPKCSDNIPYPEKFTFSLFEQLKNKMNNFRYQYPIENKRIDFYFELNNIKYGIETDGNLGHGNDNPLTGQTAEETTADDEYKNRLAEKYNIKLIRIDCRKSNLEHIKNSIMKSKPSLPEILNFKEEDINWLKCHEYACNSLVKEICKLWREGMQNTKDIANKFNISRNTITKYLKQGTKLGWCEYDADKERGRFFSK